MGSGVRRAAAKGGPVASRSRCSRIFRADPWSAMKAIILSRPYIRGRPAPVSRQRRNARGLFESRWRRRCSSRGRRGRRCWRGPGLGGHLGNDAPAHPGVRGEHPVVPDPVYPRRRDERRQLRKQFRRRQRQPHRPAPWPLHPVEKAAVCRARQAVQRQRWPQDVSAQLLPALPVVAMHSDAGVKRVALQEGASTRLLERLRIQDSRGNYRSERGSTGPMR